MPTLSIADARRRDWGAVLFALGFPTVVTIVYFVLLAGHPSLWQQGAYGVGKLLQFAFPVVWFVAVQRGRFAWRRPQARELIEGGLVGATVVLLMLALYFGKLRGNLPADAVDAMRAKVQGMGVDSLPRYAALGTFYALGHSLLEEYYWRWFVFGQLRALTTTGAAVIVSALGFMAHHVCLLVHFFGWNAPWNLFLVGFFSLSVAVGGVLWALLYRRHGSLYGAWLSHLLVDTGIFAIGYDLVLR